MGCLERDEDRTAKKSVVTFLGLGENTLDPGRAALPLAPKSRYFLGLPFSVHLHLNSILLPSLTDLSGMFVSPH